MSSSATADTWILLENQRCFLLCHICCYILIFGGKVLWKSDSYKPERSGGWVCCAYEENKAVNYTGHEGKEGLADVGLAPRFPSSLGSAMPGAPGTGSRSLPTSPGGKAPIYRRN